MAHLSKDKSMIADFLSGNDIHAATAAKIFGVDIKRCYPRNAKQGKNSKFWDHLWNFIFRTFGKVNISAEKRQKILLTAISILIPE